MVSPSKFPEESVCPGRPGREVISHKQRKGQTPHPAFSPSKISPGRCSNQGFSQEYLTACQSSPRFSPCKPLLPFFLNLPPLKTFYFICVSFCPHICLGPVGVPVARGGQKTEASAHLELELQMLVGHCVDLGDQTWLLLMLSHLSSPGLPPPQGGSS